MQYPHSVGFRKHLFMLAQEPVRFAPVAVKHFKQSAYSAAQMQHRSVKQMRKTVAAVLQQQATPSEKKAMLLRKFSSAQEKMLQNLKRTEAEVKKSPSSEQQKMNE
jgi:Fe-S cluster assembly ATPase SufC